MRHANQVIRFVCPILVVAGCGDASAPTRHPLASLADGVVDASGLVYSTYLAGAVGPTEDIAAAIAVDAEGNAYITGYTNEAVFPTTAGAFQTAPGSANYNAFVTKLTGDGSGLVYSTYLGGNSLGSVGPVGDRGLGIAVDASGNAYITGITQSTNFPTTAGAFQTAFGGGQIDAFVTKLDPTGSGLIYSTYLGGNGFDAGSGIAIDAAGTAYVTGSTGSGNFPTTAGAFQTAFGGGRIDAFVTKLDPTGSGLIYSTYLGGDGPAAGSAIAVDAFVAFVAKLNRRGTALAYSTYLGGGDNEGRGIAVDASGHAYVTGSTSSTNFPTTPGAFQTTYGGGVLDAFVTKLNRDGTALAYSTYLGGSDFDEGSDIAVAASGHAYVTGSTRSTNFPTSPGVFQTTYGGGFQDAFVAKLNRDGSALPYSTYLGGSDYDEGVGIAVDASGHAYVTGSARSTNFPTTPGAFQTTYGGGALDAFVTKLNRRGTALAYSTYLGGSGADFGRGGIALDAGHARNPNVYVAGFTESRNFPTTPGAFQPTFRPKNDEAFVAKLQIDPCLTVDEGEC